MMNSYSLCSASLVATQTYIEYDFMLIKRQQHLILELKVPLELGQMHSMSSCNFRTNCMRQTLQLPRFQRPGKPPEGLGAPDHPT